MRVLSQRGGFAVAVSGKRHGIGSPREAAPYAERASGIRIVLAESFDPAYRQYCHALGLLTSTDLGLVDRIRRGEAIPMACFTEGLDPLTAEIVRRGGLFELHPGPARGEAGLPLPGPGPQAHDPRREDPRPGRPRDLQAARGSRAWRPGTASWSRPTGASPTRPSRPWPWPCCTGAWARTSPFEDPATILAFRDHLTFMGRFYTQDEGQPGLLEVARRIKKLQEEFCARHGIRLHGEASDGGCEGICHVLMAERYALPGQVIVGTDSHTSHSGALGALAFGVGAADIANAWVTGDVRVTVPPTVLVRLQRPAAAQASTPRTWSSICCPCPSSGTGTCAGTSSSIRGGPGPPEHRRARHPHQHGRGLRRLRGDRGPGRGDRALSAGAPGRRPSSWRTG